MVRFSHIAWVLLVAVCLLMYVFTGQVAVLCVAFSCVAVPFFCLIPTARAMRFVTCELTGPGSVAKGKGETCELVVRNGSRMPLSRVVVTVEAENLLTGERGVLLARASVAPGGKTSVPCVLESRYCGRIECRLTRLSGYEPFGLLRRSVSCEGIRAVNVMPELYDVRLARTLSYAPLSDKATYSQLVRGQDASETFGLREYEAGDDLRRIHWKLSDKIGSTIVREASLPIDNSILVFWDKSLLNAAGDTAGTRDGRAGKGVASGSGGRSASLAQSGAAPAGADRRPAATPAGANAMAEVMLALCERLSHDGVECDVACNDARSGSCLAWHVAGENDLYEVIGHLMSLPMSFSSEGGIDAYLREYGRFACSRIFYVGEQAPLLQPANGSGLEMLAFACDGATGFEGDHASACIHFGPEGVEQALADAGVV